MSKINLTGGIKYVLFLAIGIVIFYFVYRGQDPAEIWEKVKEFKIEWILISFVFSLFSHIIRALRWRMMIQPLGYSPSRLNSFLAILVMYLANFVFPRLGEVSRCGVLTKYEKVPFAQQIGTVVTERLFDFIMLLLILLGLVLMRFDVLTGFIENNRERIGFDSPLISSPLFWGALVFTFILIGSLLYSFRKKILSSKIAQKVIDLLKKFWEGFLSVKKLKRPGLFVFYSVLIYVCYFMMTYTVFLGFEPARELGVMAAFAALAMGSVGMVIPVQGGIGTYHFFVIQTVLVFGMVKTDGQTLALVLHGSTTIFMIFIGLIALLALPIVNRKSQ